MSELIITELSVKKDNLCHVNSGGAYRVVKAEIVVDSSRDIREQRVSLVHEVLGVFLGVTVDADTITEIAEHICDSMDKLAELIVDGMDK